MSNSSHGMFLDLDAESGVQERACNKSLNAASSFSSYVAVPVSPPTGACGVGSRAIPATLANYSSDDQESGASEEVNIR